MKKCICLILSVIMLLTLCACGSNNGSETDSTTGMSQQNTPVTNQPGVVDDVAPEDRPAEPADLEYTLSEYLATGETIWFSMENLKGKDSYVNTVYVFEPDGTYYSMIASEYHMLGEYEQMDDSAIVEMVKSAWVDRVLQENHYTFIANEKDEALKYIYEFLVSLAMPNNSIQDASTLSSKSTDEMAAWLDANPDDLLAMSEFMREPLIEELPVLEELSEAINVLCKKTMESPDIKANKAYWTCYDIVGKVLFMDWYDAEFVKAQDIETEVDALRELIPGIRAAAERIYETVATRIEDSRSDVAPGEYRLSLRTDSTGNNTAHEQIHVSRPDGSLFYGLKLSYLYPAGSNNGNCTTVVYDSLYGGYIYLDDSYFFTRVSDNIHFTLDAVGTYDLSIDVKDYESLFD